MTAFMFTHWENHLMIGTISNGGFGCPLDISGTNSNQIVDQNSNNDVRIAFDGCLTGSSNLHQQMQQIGTDRFNTIQTHKATD
jgi:hypothetical protein